MSRALAVVAVLCILMASHVSAAPPSLSKGTWSAGYTADSGSSVLLGVNVADRQKVVINFGLTNVDNGTDSETAWNIGGAYHYFLEGPSNEWFAPFIGGNFTYLNLGEDEFGDTVDGYTLEGRFGGEAFPVEPLSIGGYIALAYVDQFDADGHIIDLGRSAIFATLYW